MADENKTLLGLLNGLARRDYYNDSDITEDFLKDELYPDLSNDEFKLIVQRATGLIKSMASTDMDFGQLEAFLTSQTRKKEGGITEAQAKVYTKFWRNNKEKIHNCLVHNSNWNNRLHNLSWRIDINSRARHVDEINTPTAIVELQLTPPNDQKDIDVVRFEMDEIGLEKMMQSLKDINTAIGQHANMESTNQN